MIIYKSPAEIDLMREAGAILGEALAHLQPMARPGVTLLELDTVERVGHRLHHSSDDNPRHGQIPTTESPDFRRTNE